MLRRREHEKIPEHLFITQNIEACHGFKTGEEKTIMLLKIKEGFWIDLSKIDSISAVEGKPCYEIIVNGVKHMVNEKEYEFILNNMLPRGSPR